MNSRPNRRRLRRHARQLHRDGFQPMMVVGSGDDLPESAVTAITRAIWRYRSELAPIVVAIATAIVANVLHHGHEDAWPWLAVVTTTTTTAFAAPLPKGIKNLWRVLDRVAERIYAAVLVATIGGWLTAATVLGPATTPMPQVAVALTTIAAIPWWISRRRRSKVSLERKLESWPEISTAIGLAGSQIMSALVDVWGWRARIRLARGQTIHDVIAKVPGLESGLGTFRGAIRVYPTPDDLANRCEIRVLDLDPHADAIPWPGPTTTTITEPIDLGPFEDATPCSVSFLRKHVLFGGATGAGKSGGLNVLMGNLAACEDVVIWGIDLKKGMELRPWQECIDRLATTQDEARDLLRDAVKILETRAARLADQAQRVWEPAPDMPALLIVIDEYAELADEAPDAIKHADSIARRGRAVAVNLVAATQRPTQKAMGHGAVRSQMDVRISFRVRERKDVDLILGQGMLAAGWQADKLNAPGKFLVAAIGYETPKRARAYLLTDDMVGETAARYAAGRPPLDEASQQAINDNHSSERIDPSLQSPPTPNADGNLPNEVLWAALSFAPDEGITVPELMTVTGMSRPWIYQRLRDLAERDQVIQVSRGRWRGVISDVS